MHGMIDAAMAAALASGIPVAEMWLESQADRVEVRLMRGDYNAQPVGESSTGITIARVWMDGLAMRYEGIELGAGWAMRAGQA